MDERLLALLRAENAWLDGMGLDEWIGRMIPEDYVPRRLELKRSSKVTLVVGPRQSGKSTLIWKTLAERKLPALLLNCEEPSIRSWLTSPALVAADIDHMAPFCQVVLFEEVQFLPEAALFLKGMVDRRTGRWLVATGSSSFDLGSRTRESLAGRAARHLLLPLSISEAAGPSGDASILDEARLRETAMSIALSGGYPSVRTSRDRPSELAGLVESFVLKDVSDRFRIRHVAAFRRLLGLLASQIGSLCNFSNWAASCGISQDTVREYVDLLEGAHVVRLVGPFVGGRRAELVGAHKVYFIDNGVRNTLFGGFVPLESRADGGALLENLVFGELAKATNPLLSPIQYWRSKSGAEVDFVVRHQGRILPIEVKSGPRADAVTRSMHSFIDAYEPLILLVVSLGAHPEKCVGKTRVRFVPVWGLAGEVKTWLKGEQGPAAK